MAGINAGSSAGNLSDEEITNDLSKKLPKEANYRLTMWSGNTHYDVVKEVAKFNADFHLTKSGN